MQTLEHRVERLERSCRRWRLGCLLIAIAAVGLGAAKPGTPVDGEFGHLTVQSLTVRGQAGGPAIFASSDGEKASLRLATAGGSTTIGLLTDKGTGRIILSHATDKGITNAALSVDDQSGAVSVSNVGGKTKEIEPQ